MADDLDADIKAGKDYETTQLEGQIRALDEAIDTLQAKEYDFGSDLFGKKKKKDLEQISTLTSRRDALVAQLGEKRTKDWITGRTEAGIGKVEGYLADIGTALTPYMQTGERSLDRWEQAMGLTGDFDAESFLAGLPGYQARMRSGQKATLAALSGRTGVGGRAYKELTRFGQGLASEYWGEYLGELGMGIKTGQGAAGMYAAAGGGAMSAATSLYGTGIGAGAQGIQGSVLQQLAASQRALEVQAASTMSDPTAMDFIPDVNVSVPL